MSEIRKLAPNVLSFLNTASADFGRIEADTFSQEMWCRLVEGDIESPIEQLFFIACQVMCAWQHEEINPNREMDGNGCLVYPSGIEILPQFVVDAYRVDFLLCRCGSKENKFSAVVVELDGHDFHDKNKEQRAYEKARDRYLVKAGYTVLHYTGSEVVADPYKVAYEALSLLGVFIGLSSYDPENPFGID